MRTNKIVWGGLGVLILLAVVVIVNKGNEPVPANTIADNGQEVKKVTVKTVVHGRVLLGEHVLIMCLFFKQINLTSNIWRH